MTLEQLSYLAQIIGTIFIVASLVYVARQLHQNTEMLKSQSRQALLANDHKSLEGGIDHPELFEALAKPEPLSFQDQYRFNMMWIMNMRNREHEYFQYRAGVLDEAAWHSYREIIAISFDSERRRKWWTSIGNEFFDPEFKQMVNEIISDTPMNDTFTRFGTWE